MFLLNLNSFEHGTMIVNLNTKRLNLPPCLNEKTKKIYDIMISNVQMPTDDIWFAE